MRIVKLDDSFFYIETDELEGHSCNWDGIIVFLEDIIEHLEGRRISEILSELAQYKNGAILDL